MVRAGNKAKTPFVGQPNHKNNSSFPLLIALLIDSSRQVLYRQKQQLIGYKTFKNVQDTLFNLNINMIVKK